MVDCCSLGSDTATVLCGVLGDRLETQDSVLHFPFVHWSYRRGGEDCLHECRRTDMKSTDPFGAQLREQ
jgi:hypothetical protein